MEWDVFSIHAKPGLHSTKAEISLSPFSLLAEGTFV